MNSPFYSCVLSDLALAESEAGVDLVLIQHAVLMLATFHLHIKSTEVCIKARSTPASLLNIQGQVTK